MPDRPTHSDSTNAFAAASGVVLDHPLKVVEPAGGGQFSTGAMGSVSRELLPQSMSQSLWDSFIL